MRKLILLIILLTAAKCYSQTWRVFNTSIANWYDIKASSDGTKAVASIVPGRLWYYNGSWNEIRPNTYDSSYSYYRVSISGDGNKMLIPVARRRLWYYNGSTWAEHNPPGGTAINRNWYVCAISADGNTMIAGVSNGRLYLYSSGTWSEIQPGGYNGDRPWTTATINSDGTRYAVCYENDSVGRIWYWDGSSWVERQPAGNVERRWRGLDMSDDGTKLIAAAYGARIYTSTNSGVNWTEVTPAGSSNVYWQSAAISANGTYMIAGMTTGAVYTYNGTSWTTTNLGGSSKTVYNIDAVNNAYYFAPAYNNSVYTTMPIAGASIKNINGVYMPTINKVNSVPAMQIKQINMLINTSSKCASAISVTHLAGTVAPVDKTVTYGITSSIPGEPTKCWITSNLGSDHQATAVDDATEASAGWYWQFNRTQGYKHDGTTRTPNTTWINSINENSNWLGANDPCSLLLGSPWRIPTKTEWSNVDYTGGWTNWSGPWGSGLKMHAGGYLQDNNGSRIYIGYYGTFCSSTQYTATLGWLLYFYNGGTSIVDSREKSYGFSVRCLRD